MPIGDYVNPTWTNDVTKLNSTNMQAITNKLNEIDKYLDSQIVYVKKASDEIVNNSAVSQSDNDFNITLDANCTYEIEVVASIITDSNADFKSKWAKGSGVTVYNRVIRASGYNTTGDAYNQYMLDFGGVAFGDEVTTGNATGYTYWLTEKLLVSTGASSNTLTFMWAQQTAVAYNTRILTGSYLKATKLTAL